jgi:putative transposase
VFLRF